MKDYLLEIGCEEIPASYIDPALAWLSENAKKELENERMSFKELTMYGTPRRLVLIVRGLSAKQADLTHEVLGPRAEAAFDAQDRDQHVGRARAAAEGTAAGRGRIRKMRNQALQARFRRARPAADCGPGEGTAQPIQGPAREDQRAVAETGLAPLTK